MFVASLVHDLSKYRIFVVSCRTREWAKFWSLRCHMTGSREIVRLRSILLDVLYLQTMIVWCPGIIKELSFIHQ